VFVSPQCWSRSRIARSPLLWPQAPARHRTPPTRQRDHGSIRLDHPRLRDRAHPGLLQTADYARHILSNVVALRRIPNDVERGVRLRLRRQEALYDPAKHFRFLLTEATLRYQPCPASTLRGQLDRLHGLFGLDTVEIAILPFDTRLPIAPVNGFWIFDGAVVLVETLSAELTLRDPDDVLVYLRLFDMLWKIASHGEAATNILARVAQEIPHGEPTGHRVHATPIVEPQRVDRPAHK
jgi:hypothetical protein